MNFLILLLKVWMRLKEEVCQYLLSFHLLEVLKRRKERKGYKSNVSKSEKIERRLLTHEDPKSPISEAYRSLRTSLMIDGAKKIENPKIILVSSPGPGEGKTTSVAILQLHMQIWVRKPC